MLPAPGLVPCVPLTVYPSMCLWLGEMLRNACHRDSFISFYDPQAQPRSSTHEPWAELGRAGLGQRMPWHLTVCVCGGTGAGNWTLEAPGWKGCVWSHLASCDLWDPTKPPNDEDLWEIFIMVKTIKASIFHPSLKSRGLWMKKSRIRVKVSKLKSGSCLNNRGDMNIQPFSVDCQRIFRRKKWRSSKLGENLKRSLLNNYVHQWGPGAGIGEGRRGRVGWLFSTNSAGLGDRKPVCEVFFSWALLLCDLGWFLALSGLSSHHW